jgi:hypothetical protein
MNHACCSAQPRSLRATALCLCACLLAATGLSRASSSTQPGDGEAPPPETRSQIDQPEVQEIQGTLQRHQLILALMQLGIVTRTHQPFQRELQIARQLGAAEPRLKATFEAMASGASTGVATVPELRDSFGIILLPKIQALQESQQGPWSDQIRSWLSSAIAPTPTPDQPVPLNQQVLLSTVDRLAEDDLRGAVEVLTQLQGDSAKLTTRWQTEANKRLSLDVAYEELSAMVLELLTRKP